MKKLLASTLLLMILTFLSSTAGATGERFISKATIDDVITRLKDRIAPADFPRIERGVNQCAALWTASDGTEEAFRDFCLQSAVPSGEKLDLLFKRLTDNWESLFGHFNMISLDLKRGMHLEIGEMLEADEVFGGYEPGAHFNEDFFNNKIAFLVMLNFPSWSLQEKEQSGRNWSREEWAKVRMGDLFTARVPSEVNVKIGEALSSADNYISGYNIYVGNLLDDKGKTHFDKNMKLLSHWNLRDELKSNYNKGDEGLFKQNMIYQVMLRIIQQDIPKRVINQPDVQWNPFTNKVFSDGKEIAVDREPDTRYATLLGLYRTMKQMDPYTPMYPDYIRRAFDGGMEIRQEDVENLFIQYCSSPVVKKVGELIGRRLGRPLQPFDIWYDGFKSRSSLDAALLDRTTREKYPDTRAFEADIPNILMKLDFKPEVAKEIASRITVDAARGSGHAWGAQMKGDKAHLRTRIGKEGMDYKGYNIAIHELGHNVEQTISLYMVDNYMMQGVPNTAFTEALAFAFQKRDLELLGIPNTNPDKATLEALDNFWASYEIMGVSLLDMQVWKWLYANPDATPEQLRETVISTAIRIWNQYYAPVFGVKDSPVLAIYSHMIDNPLYLSNYPLGHLIEFQIDRQLEGANFADQVIRIYSQGRLVPQLWMEKACGMPISIQPLIEAADDALRSPLFQPGGKKK